MSDKPVEENTLMPKVLVLNGPNLNLLGTREPAIYGSDTLADIEERCQKTAASLGLEVASYQSNYEGRLIDIIHKARGTYQAIVFNPGAYAHTSVALRDAVTSASVMCVEVHISNIYARLEEFRHHSYIAAVADAVISGAGAQGYSLALEHIAKKLKRT